MRLRLVGATLAQIRKASGAHVRCLDPLDSSDAAKYRETADVEDKRLVLIEGLSAQVQEAKRLVLDAQASHHSGTSTSASSASTTSS